MYKNNQPYILFSSSDTVIWTELKHNSDFLKFVEMATWTFYIEGLLEKNIIGKKLTHKLPIIKLDEWYARNQIKSKFFSVGKFKTFPVLAPEFFSPFL